MSTWYVSQEIDEGNVRSNTSELVDCPQGNWVVYKRSVIGSTHHVKHCAILVWLGLNIMTEGLGYQGSSRPCVVKFTDRCLVPLNGK